MVTHQMATCECQACVETRLREEMRVTEELLASANAVLALIPECPQHGQNCHPHQREWIEQQLQLREAAWALVGLVEAWMMGPLFKTAGIQWLEPPPALALMKSLLSIPPSDEVPR